MDQHEQRQRIYEHFGLSRPDARSGASRGPSSSNAARASFGRSSLNAAGSQESPSRGSFGVSQSLSRSVLGRSVGRGTSRGNLFSDVSERANTIQAAASEDPSLRNKQERYAVKVKELNLSRLQERVYPVIEEFARVEIGSSEDVSISLGLSGYTLTPPKTPHHLVDAYRALKRITGEDSSVQSPSDPGAIRQRHYAKEYLETSDSGRSLDMKKRILAGSKAYVEER